MAKYVPDTSSQKWVIIASERTKRGGLDLPTNESHGCLFCEGHEHLSPKEVYRLGPGHPDTPGWKVRVLTNKYPITDIHELVIHSPDHDKDFEQFSHTQAENLFTVFKDRFNLHKVDGQVLIFTNHGAHAGASQTHPHSQIAVFPKQINLNMLSRQAIKNTILETKHFTTYCPDFSQWPYEVWIAPHVDDTYFGDSDDEAISDLSLIMKRISRALSRIYETADIFAKVDRNHHTFGYNITIYPHKNWYLRIIPRFVHPGGIEVATGVSVNVVDPADAAGDLMQFLL